MAKILAFDIETAPNLGYVWGKYEQDILSYQQEGYMLCFSYRWLHEKTVKARALPDYPSYKKYPTNDKALVQDLYDLFEQADIVIAHNGDAFDIKYANGRFLAHGLPPPRPYQTVDTLKIARQLFKLNSNKLDDLGNLLAVGRKVETGGFKLWLGCMAGDAKAWSKMVKYNKQDVDLLVAVYERLQGWKRGHPNRNTIDQTTNNCASCGHHKLWKLGEVVVNGGRKQRYRCQKCGANNYSSLKKGKPLVT